MIQNLLVRVNTEGLFKKKKKKDQIDPVIKIDLMIFFRSVCFLVTIKLMYVRTYVCRKKYRKLKDFYWYLMGSRRKINWLTSRNSVAKHSDKLDFPGMWDTDIVTWCTFPRTKVLCKSIQHIFLVIVPCCRRGDDIQELISLFHCFIETVDLCLAKTLSCILVVSTVQYTS